MAGRKHLRMDVLAPWILDCTLRRKPLSALTPYRSLQALRKAHSSLEPAHAQKGSDKVVAAICTLVVACTS